MVGLGGVEGSKPGGLSYRGNHGQASGMLEGLDARNGRGGRGYRGSLGDVRL